MRTLMRGCVGGYKCKTEGLLGPRSANKSDTPGAQPVARDSSRARRRILYHVVRHKEVPTKIGSETIRSENLEEQREFKRPRQRRKKEGPLKEGNVNRCGVRKICSGTGDSEMGRNAADYHTREGERKGRVTGGCPERKRKS